MKKSKLFLSIVSLCFSLAVLCFGVYAAGQVAYTISGTISYGVSDAYVDIDTKVYQSDAFPATKQDLAVVAGELASTDGIAGKHINLLDSDTLNTVNQQVSDPYEPVDDPDFDFNDTFEVNSTNYNVRSVYIITKITNIADNNVYAVPSVELKRNSVAIDPATYNIVEYMSNGYSVIEKDDTVTIILAYTLSDMTVSVGELTFDYAIDIQAGDYTPEQTLSWDNANGYWYINLGTTDGTANGSAVKWRLYSIDGGATKYDAGVTANNNVYPEPAYPIGQGIFVQETVLTHMAFNNDYDEGEDGLYYKKENDELTTHLANDYFASDIYTYLTTTFASDIGVTSNTLYTTAIKQRSQADLSQDMDPSIEEDWITFNTSNHASLTTNHGAKFWLLSIAEASAIIGGTAGVWDCEDIGEYLQWDMSASGWWWLRSPFSDFANYAYCVYDDGDYSNEILDIGDIAARAAFQLAL